MLSLCLGERCSTSANKNIAFLGRILLLGGLARSCTHPLSSQSNTTIRTATTIHCLLKSRSAPPRSNSTTSLAKPGNCHHLDCFPAQFKPSAAGVHAGLLTLLIIAQDFRKCSILVASLYHHKAALKKRREPRTASLIRAGT